MFVMGGGGCFNVCIFACVGGSNYFMGLIGKLPNEVGYWCV
jgi:hypothetical protein